MPIRFRCTACGGVLAIAKRKAGTNVLCPKCSGSLVVPGASTVPDPEQVELPVRGAVAGEAVISGRPAGANGKRKPTVPPGEDRPLFERLDFESLLQPAAAKAKAKDDKEVEPAKAEAKPAAAPPSPPVVPAAGRFRSRADRAPERELPPEPRGGIVQITRIQLIALVILVFCLVAMGVGVGYAMGRP